MSRRRQADDVERGLVEWRAVGRRLKVAAAVWAVVGAVGAGISLAVPVLPGSGGAWAGIAALGFVASAIAITARSALTGMLRAGEQGERLAERDVGLLPPRLRRRR